MSVDFSQIPFDRIVRFGQRTLVHRDLFSVSWLLGRYCNYACPYCWPYARSDVKDHRPTELLISTMDEIKRQSRERNFNAFHFSFSGGEPTLHPGYLDLLAHYSNDEANYQSVHMTTNLSPGMRWFEKYVWATKNLHRVSITASWHRTPMTIKNFDLKKHMNQFRDKLVFLQENDIHVTINMVMVPDMWDELYDEANFFHESGINVTLKPQSNTSASEVVEGYTNNMRQKLHTGLPQRNYTQERMDSLGITSTRPRASYGPLPPTGHDPKESLQVELEDDTGKLWYIDQAERFNAFGFNKFTGWECEAGYRSIIIREPDGSIKRSYSCHDQPLGNIQTGFRLFDGPKACQTPSCVSSADSKIPKRRPQVPA